MADLASDIKKSTETPPVVDKADFKVDLSDDLTVRMTHLVLEEGSKAYLDLIFGAVNKNLRRAELDDKSLRTIEHWRYLCAEFYNNVAWKPLNGCDDQRCYQLDPSHAPETPLTGEQLRAMFTDVRGKYTRMYANWKQSGNIEQGADNGEGDDDFYENFCGKDSVYLYIHLAYAGAPPSYCMRNLDDDLQCEEGIGGVQGNRAVNAASDDSSGKKKRRYDALSKDDLLEVLQKSIQQDINFSSSDTPADIKRKQAAMERDIAIQENLKSEKMQKEILFWQAQMERPGVTDASRALMEKKVTSLITKACKEDSDEDA